MAEPDEKFVRVKALFLAAVELEPSERDRFLEKACRNEPGLRRELEGLLEAHQGEDSLLDRASVARLRPSTPEVEALASFEGVTLGHYQLGKLLGRGGTGSVYEARDQKLGRDVAIKILPGASLSPEGLGRFEREARAIAALNHAGIVQLYSVEETGGLHFLVMERVHGTTLDARIPPGGLDAAAFLDVAAPLTEAVAAAHHAGVLHRDLKPANVMVADDGRVTVLDFGLAKLRQGIESAAGRGADPSLLTVEGTLMGTPSYMSPEQALGGRTDERSDVFSLGALFYEMLSGVRPFEGETVSETVAKILDAKPEPLSTLKPAVPTRLCGIVHRCLEREPSRRYRDADALLQALANSRSGSVLLARLARGLRSGLGAPLAVGALWVLVNLPVFAVFAAHYPRWDERFLRILQSSPGQYAFQLFLFPFIAYFAVTGLRDLRAGLARPRRKSVAGGRPRAIVESRAAVASLVIVFGALLSYASMDPVPGLDQLPPPAARSLSRAREIVARSSYGSGREARAQIERELSHWPSLASALGPVPPEGSAELVIRSLSREVRDALESDRGVRQDLLARVGGAEERESPGLVESVARIQVWSSPALKRGTESALYHRLEQTNRIETLALLYVQVVLALGAISILGLRARLGRLPPALANPAAAFAFGFALFSTWSPLRAYVVYEEDFFNPQPGGPALWIPNVSFFFCLTMFSFLSISLVRWHRLAFVVTAVILGLAGYGLLGVDGLLVPLRRYLGAGASPQLFAVSLTLVLGFSASLAYWWAQIRAAGSNSPP
jgi:Protein kinase domain